MKKSLFFAVFLVLFILGCTSASGPAGPGLTIREFSFSPTSLSGAQKTALTLVVQNTGSMDVKEAYAKIFGFGKESGLWNVATACEGCGTGDKNTEAKIPLLRAQSSFAGNVGEQKKFVWLLQNNDNIPEDMARSYTANARLCYPYSTTALGRVELMSENEWMSKNSPQHEIIVSQTSAPVRITVLSKQPIISSGRLSLDLLIENVGGGTVASPGYCRYNFGGIIFSDIKKIQEAEFRAFAESYFDAGWTETPAYSYTNGVHVLTGKNKNGLTQISLNINVVSNTRIIATLSSAGNVVKEYTFPVKDNVAYEDDSSAASRLNRLNLEISGLTKEKCTTSVGTSNSIFLEKGKSVKVSADCGIGSESAPVSAADLKIEMGYDYYVDAKATVGVKGPNEGGLALPVIVPIDSEKIELKYTDKDFEPTSNTVNCNSKDNPLSIIVEDKSNTKTEYKFLVTYSDDEFELKYNGKSIVLPHDKGYDILETKNHKVYFGYSRKQAACNIEVESCRNDVKSCPESDLLKKR